MVRVVADPSGRLIPDLKGTMPSRGAYVCPDPACIRKAMSGRIYASLKVTRRGSEAGGRLQEDIARAYRKRALSLLGQARKSGRVTSGTSLVEGELRRGSDGTWLGLLAVDASPDTGERIRKAFTKAAVPFREFFRKEELGDTIGKSPRSAVLVRDGGMAKVIGESLDRWKSVVSDGGSDQ
jgi:predicted RNA-binding protein YlxR (DUF448 family)